VLIFAVNDAGSNHINIDINGGGGHPPLHIGISYDIHPSEDIITIAIAIAIPKTISIPISSGWKQGKGIDAHAGIFHHDK
jgi:hypothetical protein